jgi:hypothetical protein
MMKIALLLAALVAGFAPECGPPCLSCEMGMRKYYSIEDPHCGEACINPQFEPLFRHFNVNVMSDNTTDQPCKKNGYGHYNGTVIHPLGQNVTLFAKDVSIV